ncbi:MAG: bifunctional phosphoglucose/phosphomannose isomerase [Candidatus Thorarchaeota archaeon]
MEDIDKNNMESMVRAFPKLLVSVEIPKEIHVLCDKIRREGLFGICIVGMGGSGIAGNYIQALLHDVSRIPIVTVRDSVLPEFVDKRWVVLTVSYSGNTEETLAAFQETLKRGCQTIAICSGGELALQENLDGSVIVPEGFQPRAAFPILFSVILQIVECLIDIDKTDLKRIEGILSKRLEEWEDSPLKPKSMAEDLLVLTPVFIGARHLIPVAYRAKCQFNENAKVMAFNSEIPESNHNEIESFNELNDQTMLPLFLKSVFLDERTSERFDIVSQIYGDEGYIPIRISMRSDTKIEEMLLMTLYLDLVSVELAHLRGVDPLTVEKISMLKNQLDQL